MKSENKLITIIVPIYNIEIYLKKCMDSILKQDYKCWEALLIDDGSTDSSGTICDEYVKLDSRFKVIHQSNQGRSSARNCGLRYAKGDYILFVDGDDWIEEDCLSKTSEQASKTQAQMVIFRCKNIYSDRVLDESTGIIERLEGAEPLEFYINGKEQFQNLNAVWGKLYRKDVLANLFFVENKYYEDIMFTTQVYARVNLAIYMDYAFYNYNIATENSITFKGVNELTFRDEIPIFYEKEKYLIAIGRADLAERYVYFIFQRLTTFYRSCLWYNRKEYAEKIYKIVSDDKKKLLQICGQDYVSKFYKIYFRLFLLSPKISSYMWKIVNRCE